MSKETQLAHWKKLFSAWESREKEISAVLSDEIGGRIYMFDMLTPAENAIRDLYNLDDSDWNNGLIYELLSDDIDLATFKEFRVEVGGSYDGLCGISAGNNIRYWREPYLVKDANN